MAVLDQLRTSPLFRGCDPRLIASVAPCFEARTHAAGESLVTAGASADAFFILTGGQATVLAVNAATGESVAVETVLSGDCVGDMGALMEGAHLHTVVTREGCTSLRAKREVLESLMTRVPGFAHALSKRLATRIIRLSVQNVRAPARAASAPDVERPAAPGLVPFVEVGDYNPGPSVLGLLAPRLVLAHRALPLQLRGKALTLGMVAPKAGASLAEIRRVLPSVEVEVVALGAEDFHQAVTRLRIQPEKEARARGVSAESLAFDVQDSERDSDKEVRVIGEEVIRVVNRIVAAGIEREASDIHVEPEASGLKVRFRVRGQMEAWSEIVPRSLARGVAARVKVLAGLDVTERRLPQDGRIGLTVQRREVDLRVSTVPAARGEKIVLRVCEAGGMLRPVDQVFVEPRTLAAIRKALHAPAAAVFVAGGTGSGKTSSLYSLLLERERARPDSNVVMVEDPIEYRLPGVTQLQVNPGAGFDFPRALRAILRQDPDVIAVGEMRDAETARIALEAALTGHMLLSTLHANGVFAGLQRLESLGCSRALLAQSVGLLLVQRLVPRLCACARLEQPSALVFESLRGRGLAEDPRAPIPVAGGCELCQHTGHAGRALVAESLVLDAPLKAALLGGKNLAELEEQARRGGQLVSFNDYAAHLLGKRWVSAADALMATAD